MLPLVIEPYQFQFGFNWHLILVSFNRHNQMPSRNSYMKDTSSVPDVEPDENKKNFKNRQTHYKSGLFIKKFNFSSFERPWK